MRIKNETWNTYVDKEKNRNQSMRHDFMQRRRTVEDLGTGDLEKLNYLSSK